MQSDLAVSLHGIVAISILHVRWYMHWLNRQTPFASKTRVLSLMDGWETGSISIVKHMQFPADIFFND